MNLKKFRLRDHIDTFKNLEVHFWDFPSKMTVKLKPSFRRKFFSQVITHFGTSKNAAKFLNQKRILKRRFTGSELRIYKSAQDDYKYDFVYANCLKELGRILSYDLFEIEKHIIAYRASNTSYIFYRRLPLKITAELTSILAHLIGDGTDKRTRWGTADYSQLSIEGRENFFNKMVNVFGKFNRSPLDVKGDVVAVPSTVTLLIKNFYSIDSFGTYECKIPSFMFSLPREHKISFLVSLLVDEGTVYDTVSLRMNNKNIVSAWRKMAISLGYKCYKIRKFVKKKDKRETYCCNLSNYSLNKLSNDIKRLSKVYPTCNLVSKQPDFDYLVKLGREPIAKRRKGLTRGLILKCISTQPLKVLEIAKLVGVCRRTVRGHLADLEKENKVCIDSKNPMGAKIWRLS